MTLPVDRILSMVKANGDLAIKFGEIARSGGADYLRLATANGPAANLQRNDKGETSAGPVVPDPAGMAEWQRIRTAGARRTSTALAEWRSAWFDILSARTTASDMGSFLRTASQSWVMAAQALYPKGASPLRAPATA